MYFNQREELHLKSHREERIEAKFQNILNIWSIQIVTDLFSVADSCFFLDNVSK